LSRRTVMKVEKGDTSVTFANVLVLMDILGLSLRLIDLNIFVRPHSQITSQAENSVRSNEDGWYE
ncbi:helix-turn-helix domain-containing protein, partial [Vibrio parahaemolyticus]|nr:transcriptional regulator [Vibrio parahaemolyticus]MCX8915936.1 transcriptional regulator [Vibrio parahaemolyticus]